MSRLDKDKQASKEPKRIEFAKSEIEKLGYTITKETATSLSFIFNGSTVTIFPYSGWHTGKTIKDGRGIDKLLKQIRS